MSHRKVESADFVGKTVSAIDARAINVIRFFFTDGTAIAIETESFGHGLTGMVACEVCAAVEVEEEDKSCSHEDQYVNDRSQFVCRDCGEELGR